jgi:uncharacterized low-complexity protein
MDKKSILVGAVALSAFTMGATSTFAKTVGHTEKTTVEATCADKKSDVKTKEATSDMKAKDATCGNKKAEMKSADKKMEGKCGEGKCGGKKMKKAKK